MTEDTLQRARCQFKIDEMTKQRMAQQAEEAAEDKAKEKIVQQFPRLELLDEAWVIQGQGAYVTVPLLNRYVMRMVQYLTYCLHGNDSAELLSQAQTKIHTEGLKLYEQFLAELQWDAVPVFMNPMLIKALISSLEQPDPIKQDEVTQWRDVILDAFSGDLEGKSPMTTTFSYSPFCNKSICIISDLSTGLKNGQDGWISIRDMLCTSDQFAHLEQINLGVNLDWEHVRELLIQRLQQSNIDESFHFFW